MAANIRFSNPKTLPKPPGYSYVVEATGTMKTKRTRAVMPGLLPVLRVLCQTTQP